MDFIFPPNLSIFHEEFRVGAWEMFLSQLNVLHWCSPISSVEKDQCWNEWKSWYWYPQDILLKAMDGTHNLRTAKHILHS
jgi:hypothetical protein